MKNNLVSKDNKSERVTVHVRMRPFTEDELKKDNSTPVEVFDTGNSVIVVRKEYEKKNFNYDSLFAPNSIQKDIYEKTGRNVVESVMKGYNGTIFAYGQTGTGKTYTMVGELGDKKKRGIIPRAFDQIFETIKHDKDHKYNVQLAFIQIYLETIQDLLEPSNENIRIREDPEQGVYLEGIQWIRVINPIECENVFLFGEKNRATASTKMNAHSSRSHAIMIVKLEKSFLISPEKIKEITEESSDKLMTERIMTKSMLFLVDLAGSERVKKTKAEAMRLEEAKKINYSLLVLGNCIQSLTDPKCNHISYRDSKLTRLLQESLGGNAKTSLIVTISPSSYNTDETVSALMFGQRAMKVQNKPIINKTVDYQALCIKLQEDLDKLNDEYAKLKIENDKLIEENNKLKNSETYMEMQRKSIHRNLNDGLRDSINSMNSNKNTIALSNSAIEEIKEKCAEELKKLENFYEEILNNKILEHENVLQEIDKVLYEKDNQIDNLKSETVGLKEKFYSQSEYFKELEKEKDDIQKRVVELTNEIAEIKRTNENSEILIKSLKNENCSYKEIINIEKISEYSQTDDKMTNTYHQLQNNKQILEIASELNVIKPEELLGNAVVFDSKTVEKIITELNDKVKTEAKLIEEKSTDFVKFVASHRELESETDKSITDLKLRNSDLDKKVNTLTTKIDELNKIIKTNEEKHKRIVKDYEEESTIMNVELTEYRKNKSQIIKEKEEVIENIKSKEKIINELKTTIEEMERSYKRENEVNLNKISNLESKNSQLISQSSNSNKDLEKAVNEKNHKIKELEEDYKNSNVKLHTNINIIKHCKKAYNESESQLNKTIINIKHGLDDIDFLKTKLGEIENVIEEGSQLIKTEKDNFRIDKLTDFEVYALKFYSIVTDSDINNIEKDGINFTNQSLSEGSRSKRNFMASGKIRATSKSPEKSQDLTHKKNDIDINTESLKSKFSELFILLENITANFDYVLKLLLSQSKFFSNFIKAFVKSCVKKIQENQNSNLELVLSTKNELYLRNSLVFIVQKILDNVLNIIHNNYLLETIKNFNKLSEQVSEFSCPELNKHCVEIIDEFNKIFGTYLTEKELEIENLNEKVIYFLRENEILKRNEQSGKIDTATNIQIQKLQSQNKLKEEEILRLNNRIEEHLKTINNLMNELNNKSNNQSAFFSNSSVDEKKETNSFLNLMQNKMFHYEDEIYQLKKQIDDQKSIFEASNHKDEDVEENGSIYEQKLALRKTNYLRERIRKNLEPKKNTNRNNIGKK